LKDYLFEKQSLPENHKFFTGKEWFFADYSENH